MPANRPDWTSDVVIPAFYHGNLVRQMSSRTNFFLCGKKRLLISIGFDEGLNSYMTGGYPDRQSQQTAATLLLMSWTRRPPLSEGARFANFFLKKRGEDRRGQNLYRQESSLHFTLL